MPHFGTLELYAKAALVEYLDQFLGRSLPTRFKDPQILRFNLRDGYFK
jgi:hypothetical protein